MTGQAAFIRIRNLTRAYSSKTGVHDLSLDVAPGSFVVLLGPSGCGKSTTLRLLAGLEAPDSGTIEVDGHDVTHLPPASRKLSMVFQSYALFPHLSVAENIVFGLKVRGVGRAERADKLANALRLVGLEGLEDRKPSRLSGGQRQRVALARAVVSGHPLCLMDEPLSNLDAKLRHSVRQEIRALQQRLAITVVYVTHDQTEAMSMADLVILMRDGRIEQAAPPADIYQRPATTFAASFVGTPPMLLLPPTVLAQTQRSEAGLTPDTVFGLRAEDVVVVPEGEGRLDAKVAATEFLGPETFLVAETAGGERLTARVPGRSACEPGAGVGLDWPLAAVHRFHRETGMRLP
ncbi:MAG: ABC transporter ATP-binding protein [Fulvimarina sp.]|nr:ABC transporter ATP-binding protein [Fulvimarina sp.]